MAVLTVLDPLVDPPGSPRPVGETGTDAVPRWCADRHGPVHAHVIRDTSPLLAWRRPLLTYREGTT
ncbi:hypothetical protein EASAB2608_00376 [Streptomyces sp. EAS-AB2608]|nr:hypothetical protein EASAB2608_00376 [Streptomyces sp. EAS-AB2608]